MTAFPSSEMVMASSGHTLTHSPQPSHLSKATSTGMFCIGLGIRTNYLSIVASLRVSQERGWLLLKILSSRRDAAFGRKFALTTYFPHSVGMRPHCCTKVASLRDADTRLGTCFLPSVLSLRDAKYSCGLSKSTAILTPRLQPSKMVALLITISPKRVEFC